MKFLWIMLCLFFPSTSLAYFDPGTGSLIIQGLIAILASIALFYRQLLMTIKESFFRITKKLKQLNKRSETEDL